MSDFDRVEIIAEIEVLTSELGMEHLTVMSKLADLQDTDLLKLRSALKAIGEVKAD